MTSIFYLIILDSIHKRLTEKTLEMIRKERQGEHIESRIIKKVIHSYVEIGQAVNVSQLKSEKKLKNYDERFLEAFLVDTGLFYAAESSHYINTHSISDYLKKARLKITFPVKTVVLSNLRFHGSKYKLMRP